MVQKLNISMISGFVVVKNNYKKLLCLLNKLDITISFEGRNTSDEIFYSKLNSHNKRSYIIKYYSIHASSLFDINTLDKLKKDIANFVFHELGHFIITPKQRRCKKDFGIPETENKKYKLEECKATMIEHELRRLFGFTYNKILYRSATNNVGKFFIADNKIKLIQWWESEGKIIAKTYMDLV